MLFILAGAKAPSARCLLWYSQRDLSPSRDPIFTEHEVPNVVNDPAPHSSRYLRYISIIAFLVTMVSLMDRYVVSILMQQIKEDLLLSDTQLGLLVGPAFVVVHILSQLPLARLADRTVRPRLIAAATLLWSLCTIAAGFAKNFPQLFITRMGVGITEAACSPTLASLISDYFSESKRGKALAMMSVGGTAGIGAGMILGGEVGAAYGWRVAMIVAGIPGILLALLVLLTVKEPREAPVVQAAKGPSTWSVVRSLFRSNAYVWLVVGASASLLVGLGRGAWEPVFLIRVYGLEQAETGLIYFLTSPLPSMVGAFFGGVLLDRLLPKDRRWYLWLPGLAMLLGLPGILAFLLAPASWIIGDTGLPMGLLFSIIGSTIAGAAGPGMIAAGQALASADVRATSHAVWTMVANLVGMGLGPLIAGGLSDALVIDYGADSIRYALTILSVGAIPAAVVMIWGARHIPSHGD